MLVFNFSREVSGPDNQSAAFGADLLASPTSEAVPEYVNLEAGLVPQPAQQTMLILLAAFTFCYFMAVQPL